MDEGGEMGGGRGCEGRGDGGGGEAGLFRIQLVWLEKKEKLENIIDCSPNIFMYMCGKIFTSRNLF